MDSFDVDGIQLYKSVQFTKDRIPRMLFSFKPREGSNEKKRGHQGLKKLVHNNLAKSDFTEDEIIYCLKPFALSYHNRKA